MSVPGPALPNQAEPVTPQQLREAVAFIREHYGAVEDGVGNIFVWLWESIQGDFNLERSVGQISFDTAISMIPGVDQVCDVRDIIANCRHINEDSSDTWAWVALGLTLIGLFPVLGSLVKGVLKIFFLFVRRAGHRAIGPAVDEAMNWVITFLRRRDMQRYWRGLRIDHIFGELARWTRQVRAQLNVGNLLRAFDRGIALIRNLVGKMNRIPVVGRAAHSYLDMVLSVRRMANDGLRRALRPLQDVMDAIIRRLELEDVLHRGAIVDARNVHFRGTLPEARAVTLMRQADPPPSWLSRGDRGRYEGLNPVDDNVQRGVSRQVARGYPDPTDLNIAAFHRMAPHDVVGPAKPYRITSPANGAAGEFWMDEATFHRLMQQSDPKTVWRKHFAVWPDWNADGQFVVMDVPAGQTLRTWRGPAASQARPDTLPGLHLEGGRDQILMKPAGAQFDTTRYLRQEANGRLGSSGLSRQEWAALPPSERAAYQPVRDRINDTRISGPYDTGWSATDFDPQLRDTRIGLPALPGQITRSSTP